MAELKTFKAFPDPTEGWTKHEDPPALIPHTDFTLTRLDQVTNPFITRSMASQGESSLARPTSSRRRTSTSTSSRREKKESKGDVVVVQQACKYYGSGKKKVMVLENLDMRVPQGAIYGLLGPSGCGKTTLLGCLVNRLKLDRGEIFIHGFPPGSSEAAVPGHRVGYMPQELALYTEFTIVETLRYFGKIHRMSSSKILKRTAFLVDFLDLPDPTRLINQLSGGQQRRVSFAAALLHEPELLILDEPTVGVDPLLRSSIWQHLLDVCDTGNTTIIITTHYIEEARQADRVGLMRGGRLLAETSPTSLIDYFDIPSLEDIFLKLCLEDGSEDNLDLGKINASFEEDGKRLPPKANLSSLPVARGTVSDLRKEVNPITGQVTLRDSSEQQNILVSPWVQTSKYEKAFSLDRFTALLMKNFIRLWRNIGFLLFSFLMPPIQTVLFCLTVGGTPYDLPMAIVNEDQGFAISPPLLPALEFNFSHVYLRNLDERTIVKNYYDTFECGYEAVLEGDAWGLIHFQQNFTRGVLAFYFGAVIGELIPDDSGQGKINVYMDNTNSQISVTLVFELLNTVNEFVMDLMKITNVSDSSILEAVPIQFQQPVYGAGSSSFTEFMAPGVILTITYFMAVGLTALSFIIERREGLYDRSWVSGVQSSEVMLAHLATQMFVMLVQITLILVFMFPVFKLPCEGNMVWVVLLAILQGFCGMTFGLMTSAISNDENTAIMMALGIFYPLLLLSGIVWPIQGIPVALRYVSYVLPQTYACEAIRAILYKGWDITYSTVYMGYLITSGWLVLHLVIALIAIRVRR